MVHETKNKHIIDHIPDTIIAVNFTDIENVNKNKIHWVYTGDKHMEHWLSYKHQNEPLVIPINVVKQCEYTIGKKCECCLFIEHLNKLHGVVLISWQLDSNFFSENVIYGDVIGHIWARGLFDQPIDLTNASYKVNNVYKQFNRVSDSYLKKQPQPTPYLPQLKFNCGFVVHELKSGYIGDLKEIQHVCGISSGNPNNPCHCCYIHRNEILKPINALNNSAAAREHESNIELLDKTVRKIPGVEKGSNSYVDSLGMSHAPLFEGTPGIVQYPGVHMGSGDNGRTWFACKYLVVCDKNIDSKLVTTWKDLEIKVYDIERELDILYQNYNSAEIVAGENFNHTSPSPMNSPEAPMESLLSGLLNNKPFEEITVSTSINTKSPPPKSPFKKVHRPLRNNSGSARPYVFKENNSQSDNNNNSNNNNNNNSSEFDMEQSLDF